MVSHMKSVIKKFRRICTFCHNDVCKIETFCDEVDQAVPIAPGTEVAIVEVELGGETEVAPAGGDGASADGVVGWEEGDDGARHLVGGTPMKPLPSAGGSGAAEAAGAWRGPGVA